MEPPPLCRVGWFTTETTPLAPTLESAAVGPQKCVVQRVPSSHEINESIHAYARENTDTVHRSGIETQ